MNTAYIFGNEERLGRHVPWRGNLQILPISVKNFVRSQCVVVPGSIIAFFQKWPIFGKNFVRSQCVVVSGSIIAFLQKLPIFGENLVRSQCVVGVRG